MFSDHMKLQRPVISGGVLVDDVTDDPLDRVLDNEEQLDVGDVVFEHLEGGDLSGEL